MKDHEADRDEEESKKRKQKTQNSELEVVDLLIFSSSHLLIFFSIKDHEGS